MSLEIARRIVQLVRSDSVAEIREILNPYSLNQKQFILSTDVEGSCFLFYAVEYHATSTITYFLEECGVDPNGFGKSNLDKLNCLMAAASLNCRTLIELLLGYGANINSVVWGYKTPVIVACTQHKDDSMKLLIENHANISIQNRHGNIVLTENLFDFDYCKYFVLNGANINLVNAEGWTALMHALDERRKKLTTFLLTREDLDIRIKNKSEEDALRIAMRSSTENFVQIIIKKGGYTRQELIRAYEMESCFCYINDRYSKGISLWKKVLKLRRLSKDTPIFNDMLPNQQSCAYIRLFRTDDIPALLYLRKLCGPIHLFTIRTSAAALSHVENNQHFFDILSNLLRLIELLDNETFLQIHKIIEKLCRGYVTRFKDDENVLENYISLIEKYHHLFREKYQRPMTLAVKHLFDDSYKQSIITFVSRTYNLLNEHEDSTEFISSEISKLVQTVFKGLPGKSLLQVCLTILKIQMFKVFIVMGADVNETDEYNETALHYLLDSTLCQKRELIKTLVDAGFDFGRVTNKRYCIPCRMKAESIFCIPKEANTLQCLAAKALCEKVVLTGNTYPKNIQRIIQTHMHIA